ncbi:MAG: aldehyde dehydrogenase family protein [Planctomycetales bacterium]|nr:aldehyde dehydrogenase family protein [Planctomycetales bacterium]
MNKPLFADVLARLGIREINSGVFAGEFVSQPGGAEIASVNPATGETIARVRSASRADYDRAVAVAQKSFESWRLLPPPRRGEVVRLIGDALRRHKEDLGLLVTLEVGKIRSEGAGEVQEMIDMCDYAVGLSRQLYGLTIASERANHRMLEQWHPLGPTGIITAFNFPVAVWAWNAMLAAVCGDTCLWKPSHLTPLTAIAVQNIVDEVVRPLGYSGVFSLVVGDRDVGEWMAEDTRLPLISATGSTSMGKSVGKTVAGRMGRSLLELGGNNGLILTESADQELALRAVLFAAVGTAGQRCTTLRRLIIHESIADAFVSKLAKAYGSVPIGDPSEPGVLLGPLIHEKAVEQMLAAVEQAKKEGGTVVFGGAKVNRPGHFVQPTIIRAKAGMNIVSCETFAPILYVLTFTTLDEAISIHNSVPQGLSSAIFTERLKEAERFLSAAGSDCGIANVNIGTSGAEIGGAFGGEKETGGGREAGSDSWKAYMRRQTCTINYGTDLPLAQGVKFEVG